MDQTDNLEGLESPEMYLKTILVVRNEKGYCREVDVANRLGYTKPSASVGIGKLKKSGYVTTNEDGMLLLTEKGQARAELVYEKYTFWFELFKEIGIDEKTADQEACRIEHAVSDETFRKIKEAFIERGLSKADPS